jgi:hypothetical protein
MIPPDTPVMVYFLASSHDPRHWTCPHQFDVGREHIHDHFGFGFGRCRARTWPGSPWRSRCKRSSPGYPDSRWTSWTGTSTSSGSMSRIFVTGMGASGGLLVAGQLSSMPQTWDTVADRVRASVPALIGSPQVPR